MIKDCYNNEVHLSSGVNTITPKAGKQLDVLCDMDTWYIIASRCSDCFSDHV